MSILKKLTIIGTIPSPIGGVSSYLFRYCQKNYNNIEQFIDLYPAKDKFEIDKNIKYIMSPFGKVQKLFFILKTFFRLRDKRLIFHFSTIRALLLLAVLPKFNNNWSLCLHHGELDKIYLRSNSFFKSMYKYSISKVDTIQYLSLLQLQFYKKYFNKYNINYEQISSYIPIDKKIVDEKLVSNEIKSFYKKYKKKLLMSGYPRSYYRYDMLINYIKKNNIKDMCITICLYGDEEEGFINKLYDTIKECENIKIIFDLNMFEFLSLMSFNDIYIRPNDVDSFGIAVADAVNLGLDVLASDICDRYNGSVIFKTGDISAFENKLKGLIK
ncbi:glycosyltransferase family protein [Aliarcobacter cryaerophilus]|uniref:glycosyltransferase n=1 Tax=Aliarcobacter cryaerophilus TaxID=28198 RepID=UPI000833E45A|nr:glycosyltransferase [Aliarcobacter cryaerophilus]